MQPVARSEETTETSGMVDNNETLSEIIFFLDGGRHILPASCITLANVQHMTERPTVHIDAAHDFVSALAKCM